MVTFLPRVRSVLGSHLPLLVGFLLAALVAALLVSPASRGADGSAGEPDDPAVEPGLQIALPRAARAGEERDFPSLPDECYDSQDPVSIKRGPCYLTPYDPSRPSVLLWGDSHAWQYQSALEQAVAGRDVNLVALLQGGCPPAFAPTRPRGAYDTKCERSDRTALAFVRRLVRRDATFKVVLGGFWSYRNLAYRRMMLDPYFPGPTGYSRFTAHLIRLAHDGTEPLFRKLGRLGVRVDVIDQSVTVPVHAPYCAAGGNDDTTSDGLDGAYQCDLPRWRAFAEESGTSRYLKALQRHLGAGSRLIDPKAVYCEALVCHHQVGGENTFWDHIHLGDGVVSQMTSYFVPTVNDVVRAARRAESRG